MFVLSMSTKETGNYKVYEFKNVEYDISRLAMDYEGLEWEKH